MQITSNCIINGLPEEIYHGDPSPLLDGFKDSASLSSSTAKDCVESTMLEARANINRLNPNKKRESGTEAMNLGELAHDFILCGGESKFEVAPVDAWRSNDAKAMKADILNRGKIPLNLSTQGIIDDIRNMKTRLFEQLADDRTGFHDILLNGKPEQSGFAFDGKIWNRARFDWLDGNHENLIVDYKTTGIPLAQWKRNDLWNEKFYQEIHYRRVLDAIRDKESAPATFCFVLQQSYGEHLAEIIFLDASYEEQSRSRYDMGYHRFVEATKTGIWPGLPPYATHACPPPWKLTGWEEDEVIAKEWAEQAKKEAQAPANEYRSVRAAG